jgi:hypothetical protein
MGPVVHVNEIVFLDACSLKRFSNHCHEACKQAHPIPCVQWITILKLEWKTIAKAFVLVPMYSTVLPTTVFQLS